MCTSLYIITHDQQVGGGGKARCLRKSLQVNSPVLSGTSCSREQQVLLSVYQADDHLTNLTTQLVNLGECPRNQAKQYIILIFFLAQECFLNEMTKLTDPGFFPSYKNIQNKRWHKIMK